MQAEWVVGRPGEVRFEPYNAQMNRPKRHRSYISDAAKKVLKAEFKSSAFPDSATRERLAEQFLSSRARADS